MTEATWILASALVTSWIPGSAWRRWVLRLFGARIGREVVIKPGVHVKFPWRLSVGDHSWLGENVWIDNVGDVAIGSNVCISQGAYLCTGSHDWSHANFALIVRPITVGDGAWIAARSVVGPGVAVGEGAVLALGAVASGNLIPWTIYTAVGLAQKPRHVAFNPVMKN
jgi:putative colanic acid biosynthesis acetyltransferase WcaF